MRIRRILTAAALIASSLIGFGAVTSSTPAGALSHPGISCIADQFNPVAHPIAPNVRKWCVGWVQSAGFAFRFEASHHYGDWGGNFDPGRWRVIADQYTFGGTWLGRTIDSTFNDVIAPHLRTVDNPGGLATYLSFVHKSLSNEPGFHPYCLHNQWPDLSQYYQEHPQFWLIGDSSPSSSCHVLGNGFKIYPMTLNEYASGHLGFPLPSVSGFLR